MVLADIFISFLLSWLVIRFNISNFLSLSIIVVAFILSFFHIVQVGWLPPMIAITQSPNLILVLFFGIGLLLTIIYLLDRYSFTMVMIFAGLLLLPVCFISTEPISLFDYGFILGPGYRITEG